jgi:ubiquinol-cytochrome c reductase iron-sulfur subunit
MRLKPEDLNELPERKGWSYDGIVAYSKICTHVGCPVALYEQQTHHLLCPCHQSQFDVSNHCESSSDRQNALSPAAHRGRL